MVTRVIKKNSNNIFKTNFDNDDDEDEDHENKEHKNERRK